MCNDPIAVRATLHSVRHHEPASLRGLIDEDLWALVELPLAASRAKVVGRSLVLARSSRRGGVYLHATHWVDRVRTVSFVVIHRHSSVGSSHYAIA